MSVDEINVPKERQAQPTSEIRWVDGDQELADSLTKPWVYEQLMKALDLGKWSITFDAEMLSARRKRQLRKGSCKSEATQGKKKIGSDESSELLT